MLAGVLTCLNFAVSSHFISEYLSICINVDLSLKVLRLRIASSNYIYLSQV